MLTARRVGVRSAMVVGGPRLCAPGFLAHGY